MNEPGKVLKLTGMDSLAQFKQEQQVDRIKNELMKNKRGRKDGFGDRESLTAYTPPKSLEKSQSDASGHGIKINVSHQQLK